MKEKTDIDAIINAAVAAAYEAGIRDIDTKIQEAVNLGMLVGIKIGANLGADAAIKAAERERKKIQQGQYDKRLHNTKLLMNNYRTLNEHYKHAVFDTQTGESESETFAEIMQAMNTTISNEELYIESIKRSCTRTKIIMAHVNRMLEIYEQMCKASKSRRDMRLWRILHSLYISEQNTSIEDIAVAEKITKPTLYADRDKGLSDLTVLFFGVEGIK